MRTVAPGDELLVSRVRVKPSSYQGKAASLEVLAAETNSIQGQAVSNTCGVGEGAFTLDINDTHSLGWRFDCLTVLPCLQLECTSS